MNRVAEISLPYEVRPTTRIQHTPLPDLSEQELLAILIGGAYASADAGLLLDHISGDLKQLYHMPLEQLAQGYSGVRYAVARRIKAALELGRRTGEHKTKPRLDSPQATANYFTLMGLPMCEQEELWVVSLNTKNDVLALSRVYRGNINSTIIRAAEVLRDAVRHNALAIIMAHNHPSGEPDPSPEDVQVTRLLREAAGLLGIDLLDHLIMAPGRWVSLKTRMPDW